MMNSKVNKGWAKMFHKLNEDQKERLWDILNSHEKNIVNSFKHYRNVAR